MQRLDRHVTIDGDSRLPSKMMLINTMPSGGTALILRENYRTNAGGTTLISRVKLKKSYVLFTYIFEILRKWEGRIKNY